MFFQPEARPWQSHEPSAIADVQPRILAAFGVSTQAELLYLEMVRDPQVDVAELVSRLGIGENTLRIAMQELIDLSLLRLSQEDGREFWPVAPEVGLELALAKEQAGLQDRQQRLAESRAALAILLAEEAIRHSSPGPHPSFEELTDTDVVYQRLEQAIHRARREVAVLEPDPTCTDRSTHERLRNRGIDVKVVCLDSARNDPGVASALRGVAELGSQIRTAPTLPLRLLVVDQLIAIVPTVPDRPDLGVTQLHGSGAVTAMYALFDQVWGAAAPLGIRRSNGKHGLDQRESAVLERMAHGDTDEAIAKKMGLSVRTIRRISADLMARLGATSRFQAGVRTIEHGWLST